MIMPLPLSSLDQRARAWGDRLGFGRTETAANDVHLRACIDWLKRAQDRPPDDGVAQTFLLRSRKWAPSYPETTGYIIPTFYRYAQRTGDADARTRARRMADWEIAVQHESGGVLAGALGDSDQPTIFNTGQVLFGWVRAFEEEGEQRYLDAAIRAADWLCEVQDADGCWRRFGSPMTGKSVNTYNTRSAWGLLRAYHVTRNECYRDAALSNARWALTQRNASGWLAENCLQDNTQPFTHTIAYAMRGLMEIGHDTGEQPLFDAAVVIGEAMRTAVPTSGALPGRFDSQWRPTVKWSCLTGDAQLAINFGRLYQITGNEVWRDAAERLIGFVKTTQKLDDDADERGGIKGSHPVDGGYHPWQMPNWAAKFFADALMLAEANRGRCDYVIRAGRPANGR